MKTRNIIAILAVLPLLAGFSGCKSEDIPEAKPAKEILRVLNKDAQFLANQETFSIEVVADCHWKVEELDYGTFNQTQFSLTPMEGIGDKNIVVNCDQNVDNADRTATLVLVSDGGLRQKVTIRQTGSGQGLNLSQSVFNFAAESAAAQILTITSNTPWTIQKPGGTDWLKLSKESGSSRSETVQITVDDAVSDASRSALLVVKYGDKVSQFEVTQEGMSFVTLNALESLDRFSYNGGQKTLSINCNAEWHAFIPSSVTWLHLGETRDSTGVVRKGSGVRDGDISVICDENNTTRERMTAIVIVSGSKDPKQVVVIVEQGARGSAEPLKTSVSLYELSVLRQSANFMFSIISEEEVGKYGVVYSRSNQQPVLKGSDVEVKEVGKGGTSQGVPCELNNLNEGTTYYVRAYVEKPSTGEIIYSNVVSITTSMGVTTLSDLTSMYVANTSAEFHFSFASDDEVGDYGLVYSLTNNMPTRADMVKTVGEGGTSHNVLAVLENLEERTIYYVRAYVRIGENFIYSPNVVTITTGGPQEPGESDNPDPTLAPKY